MTTVMLKEVRIASVGFFEARSFEKDRQAEFFTRVIYLKNSPAAKTLNEAVKAEFKSRWGSDAKKLYQVAKANSKILLNDGAKQMDKDGFDETVYYTNCSSKDQPLVINRARQPVTKEAGLFYPGCVVNVMISLYSYDHPKAGKGVGCDLKGIQFVADGEPLATGQSIAKADEFPELDENDPDANNGWDDLDAELDADPGF